MKPASQLDLEKEALGCGILVIGGFFTLVGGWGRTGILQSDFSRPSLLIWENLFFWVQ